MTPALRHLAAKEVRALLPTWFAGSVVLGLIALSGTGMFSLLALLACVLVPLALGASSIGHEYRDRTLGQLLAQPLSRSLMLAVKLGVLTGAVGSFCAIGWWVLFSGRVLHIGLAAPGASASGLAIVEFVALTSLFIAPALSMAARGTMGGTVFALTILLVVWQAAAFAASVAAARSDVPLNTVAFTQQLMWIVMLAASAIGGVLGWRGFLHLQAIDGRGTDFQLPRWRRPSATAALQAVERSPGSHGAMGLLLRKELHVQQMTFLIATLYVLMWAIIAVTTRIWPGSDSRSVGALRDIYPLLLALVAGSMVSAEERQFGTIAWQVLLPVPMWKQWGMKVGVATLLAITLGFGLPAVLEWVAPFRWQGAVGASSLTVILAVSLVAIYSSSITTSGARALLLALPLTVVTFWFMSIWVMQTAAANPHMASGRATGPQTLATWLLRATAALIATLLLRFALENHRSLERSQRRLWRQAAVLAGSASLSLLLPALLTWRQH